MHPSKAATEQAEATETSDVPFAAEVLRAEARAITGVVDQLEPTFDAAVSRLLACEGTVIASGMGKSGIIAQKLSATLASTGTPSHYLHPTEALHGDLGRIRQRDVLVLLSYGGRTEEALSLAAIARQDRVATLAITARADNHLAQVADVPLAVGDITEACPHNLAPTASTTAMLAVSDALALAVSRRRNFSEDEFHKRHPGGSLGRQMLPIVDVLRFRAGENLPMVREDRTTDEVLAEAGRFPRRAGAVLLVDDNGTLTGIFTDADLRRLLVEEGPAILRQPVHRLMTRAPRALRETGRVQDAVQLIRESRVDEIPVVDGEGRPVGLVDVQDLVALKVVE